MKHLSLFFLMVGLLLCMIGCRLNGMEPEEKLELLDGIAEDMGSSQITDDKDLIGTRVLADSSDTYAGDYTAVGSDMSGRDVVFGGASIHGKALVLSGKIKPESGTATVRIRMNEEVFVPEPDADGYFETPLKLDNGGNYIMVVYEHFTGSVELACECVVRGDADER